MVALLAMDETYLKAEKCSAEDIRGVVAVSGVYTISPLVLGSIFGKDDEVCKAASPVTHVKGNHPPFLIAYGNKDFPFMDIMAEDFGKKLKDAKCDATVMKLERDHFSIIIQMAGKADDQLDEGDGRVHDEEVMTPPMIWYDVPARGDPRRAGPDSSSLNRCSHADRPCAGPWPGPARGSVR